MFLGHLQNLWYARPPNTQLIFCKPGNSPLFDDLDRPGLGRTKKNPCLEGVHYIKISQFWLLIKKLHRTKSDQRLILKGVPSIKILEFQKFGPPGHPHPPALFSRAVGWKSKFCSQPFNHLLLFYYLTLNEHVNINGASMSGPKARHTFQNYLHIFQTICFTLNKKTQRKQYI